MLEKKLKSLDNDFQLEIAKVKSLIQIEEIRINFLGKKSIIVDLFSQLKTFVNEDKKTAGAFINNQREKISSQIESIKHKFETQYLFLSNDFGVIIINGFLKSLCICLLKA